MGVVLPLTEIDRMTGRAFEKYLAELFVRLGYAVERTEWYDLGTDLIVTRDGVRTAVQAKRAAHPVRIDAVRAVAASLATYRCERGIVVTNAASFTAPARRLAADADVELWARRELQQAIRYVQQRTSCVLCGKSVTDRVAKWCLDRPDEFRGRIYCFEHQRRPAGVLKIAR